MNGLLIAALLLVIALLLGFSALSALYLAVYFFVGIFIGTTARFFLPGRNRIGILSTGLFGAVGAIGGGLIADYFDGGLVIGVVSAVAIAAVLIGLTYKNNKEG